MGRFVAYLQVGGWNTPDGINREGAVWVWEEIEIQLKDCVDLFPQMELEGDNWDILEDRDVIKCVDPQDWTFNIYKNGQWPG